MTVPARLRLTAKKDKNVPINNASPALMAKNAIPVRRIMSVTVKAVVVFSALKVRLTANCAPGDKSMTVQNAVCLVTA